MMDRSSQTCIDLLICDKRERALVSEMTRLHLRLVTSRYYTTEYLIDLEKSLGDDILDLYYDEDEPEIDDSKLLHFIEEVEK